MANKYSRYELQPFPSLYVDNKRPEIAQLLAQRYDANKTSKDLIDRTLSQLELLDGDKAHLERVKTDVKGALKDHIENQDWENSSLVVHDAAQMVETDAGLIASNKSMQNRQAEITAMREAKLNGIPMLDFGEESRKAHQSYYYDDNAGTYVTNVYEPMMQQQLGYRAKKEDMIGKIPASQRGNWMGVSRGKTNRTANLMVEQYITDTKEGIQEFQKLVEMDLPQSLPLEERSKMAKAQILMDFKEIARQQEFSRVAGGGGNDDAPRGAKPGTTFTSSITTPLKTSFDSFNDKYHAINQKQISLLAEMQNPANSEEYNASLQVEFNKNAQFVTNSIKDIANKTTEGRQSLVKFQKLEDRFNKLGPDGKRLLAATQYLTYNTSEGDTDWDLVQKRTLQYSVAGGGSMATYGAVGGTVVLPGAGTVAGAAGMGAVGAIGGGITGFTEGIIESQFKDLKNVRNIYRPQETGFLGIDDEREQLADELWGNEDFNKANVEGVNKLLGTNFEEKDLEELMSMTNAYYTFMTKDKMKNDDGEIVDRMSGDDLMDQVTSQQFTTTQNALGFDGSGDGKKLRDATNSYFNNNFSFQNSGLSGDGFTIGSGEHTEWLANGGKGGDLQLKNVLAPQIGSNTPMRLTLGFENDQMGDADRTFTVTDPTVVQQGGWIYDLLDDNYGKPDMAIDELIRQGYDEAGYSNVNMDNYISDMTKKKSFFEGGTNEDLLEYKRAMENNQIVAMLLSPHFKDFQRNIPGSMENEGIMGIQGQTGFVPFMRPDQSFNMESWYVLQNKPSVLQALRNQMLETSLDDFNGIVE